MEKNDGYGVKKSKNTPPMASFISAFMGVFLCPLFPECTNRSLIGRDPAGEK